MLAYAEEDRLASWLINNILSCADIGCLGATIWDIFSTLSEEITLVWESTWSLAKVFYILSRYFPILVYALYFAFLDRVLLPKRSSDRNQQKLINHNNEALMQTGLLYVNLCFIEGLLALRVRALWQGSRPVTIVLLIAFVILTSVVLVLFIASYLEVVTLTQYLPAIEYGMFAGFYILVLALTGIRAWQTFVRKQGTSFVCMVYTHGMLYYALLLGLAILEIFTTLARGLDGSTTLSQCIQRIMPFLSSVVAARITLSLKKASRVTTVVEGSRAARATHATQLGTLVFAAPGGTNTTTTTQLSDQHGSGIDSRVGEEEEGPIELQEPDILHGRRKSKEPDVMDEDSTIVHRGSPC